MKFEYNYVIGPEGIEFSLIDDFDDELDFEGDEGTRRKIQTYIMYAWQQAINATSASPDEIRSLMETPEGQALLRQRAEGEISKMLESFPRELDRRRGDRRDPSRPRDAANDRRRIGTKHED